MVYKEFQLTKNGNINLDVADARAMARPLVKVEAAVKGQFIVWCVVRLQLEDKPEAAPLGLNPTMIGLEGSPRIDNLWEGDTATERGTFKHADMVKLAKERVMAKLAKEGDVVELAKEGDMLVEGDVAKLAKYRDMV